VITLSKDAVIKLHEEQIERFGGMPGIRDDDLLESALNSAFASFAGEDLYPTALAKIVRISYNLILNHAFVDGNKRIGAFVLLLLLKKNDINCVITEDELIEITLAVANHNLDYNAMVEYVERLAK
jgi:death-on-curing protein